MTDGEFCGLHRISFEMGADTVPCVKMCADDKGVSLFMSEEGCGASAEREYTDGEEFQPFGSYR